MPSNIILNPSAPYKHCEGSCKDMQTPLDQPKKIFSLTLMLRMIKPHHYTILLQHRYFSRQKEKENPKNAQQTKYPNTQ